MTISVALTHRTRYRFDRHVKLWPHEIRLRPAAHSRTPILSYSLKVTPSGKGNHFLNWQQDPFGNWVARLVFPDKADWLEVNRGSDRRHDGHQSPSTSLSKSSRRTIICLSRGLEARTGDLS
ncbi:MAG: hypothetical protein IPO13_16405 [Rhodocyclaceae bacterium]|nr:hypothetical protein [Rhodocyclaceae bacterium]